MTEPTIQVDGAARLRTTMRKAGRDLGQIKTAHERAARIGAEAGRRKAPVGPSGRLSASVRYSGTNTRAYLRAGYASVPYANPIHWGWPARGIKEQPFLSQGAVESQPRWVPVYEAAVEEILRAIQGD